MSEWFPIIALCISAASFVVAVSSLLFNRHDKGEERVKTLQASQKSALDRVEKQLTERIESIEAHNDERHEANVATARHMEQSIAGLIETVKSSPRASDIQRLTDAIRSLGERVGEIDGGLKANTRLTESINSHLMGKKS